MQPDFSLRSFSTIMRDVVANEDRWALIVGSMDDLGNVEVEVGCSLVYQFSST